jgi:hypothetical protein
MPGPAPNPNARRRNVRPEWRRLPAAGRQGDPPAWPLPGRWSKAELELWRQLWASPQAIAWESFGWARMVARYVRAAVRAERQGAKAYLLSEVRQLEDRLGLNPMAMKRLQWVIAVDVDEEPAGDEGDNIADIERYRDRLSLSS